MHASVKNTTKRSKHIMKKNQEIVQAILGETERKDFWISTETINILLKEAEQIQLTKAGILRIDFEDYVLGVEVKEKLLSDADIAYVQVMYLRDKSDILYLAEVGTENCALL